MNKQLHAAVPAQSGGLCQHRAEANVVAAHTTIVATSDSWAVNRLPHGNHKNVIDVTHVGQWRDAARIAAGVVVCASWYIHVAQNVTTTGGGWGVLPNSWVPGQSPTRTHSTSDIDHSELDDNDLQALEHLGGLASLIEEETTTENHAVEVCSVVYPNFRQHKSEPTGHPPQGATAQPPAHPVV